MQVFNNPLFTSQERPSVQDIIKKYDQRSKCTHLCPQEQNSSSSGFESEVIKSGDVSEKVEEINDIEDANVSKLLGQLALDNTMEARGVNICKCQRTLCTQPPRSTTTCTRRCAA